MSVEQKWQRKRDKAKEKLKEASNLLADALEEGRDCPEPPSPEHIGKIISSRMQIRRAIQELVNK